MLREVAKAVIPAPARASIRRGLERLIPRPPVHLPNTLGCVVGYNRYGGYCIPLSSIHMPAAQTVKNGGVWEAATIEFIRNHAGTGDVIHAGTYFGDFLPALSNALQKDAILWAFEPNGENFRCASITCAVNGLLNVRLTNAGLGRATSRGSLLTSEHGRALGGTSRFVANDAPNAQPVNIVSIDAIIPADRHVSVLQLDVEKFEEEALRGAISTIKRSMPVLVLESVPSSDWFWKQIVGLGYKLVAKLDENSIFLTQSHDR